MLHHWDIQQAKALWGAWWDKAPAEMGFRELVRRNLVSVTSMASFFIDVDGVERLQIHDVVRSLGVGILRDAARATSYYGSRLWSRDDSEFLDWSKVRVLERSRASATVFVWLSLIDIFALCTPPAAAMRAAGGCCTRGLNGDAACTA